MEYVRSLHRYKYGTRIALDLDPRLSLSLTALSIPLSATYGFTTMNGLPNRPAGSIELASSCS